MRWSLRLGRDLRRRSAATLVAATATLAAGVSAADAASVAYLDGNEVWVSTLDGSRKLRLSGGEGIWRAVDKGDGGHVLATKNEPNKMGNFATFRIWNAGGTAIHEGPLTAEPGWQMYVQPVGLAITPEGDHLVYGYSNSRGFVPNATFQMGHYVIPAGTRALNNPYKQQGQEWPTLFGRRVVSASSRSEVSIQAADGAPPYNPSFTPWLGMPGGYTAQRTDVAANGRVAATELRPDSGPNRIAVLPIASAGGALQAGDCFLPTAGSASSVSLSPDGTQIAWRDDQGVKIAGVPDFSGAEPCNLRSAPRVISATGTAISIGGGDLPASLPGGGAGGAGGGAGANPARGLGVTLPRRGRAAALTSKGGLAISVTVPAAGLVRVSAAAPRRWLGLRGRKALTFAKGSTRARRAGKVTVRLKAVRSVRRRVKRLKGRRVTLSVRQGRLKRSAALRLR